MKRPDGFDRRPQVPPPSRVPSAPAKPTRRGQKPVDPDEGAQSARPVQPAKPVHPAKRAEPAKPTRPTNPIKPVEPTSREARRLAREDAAVIAAAAASLKKQDRALAHAKKVEARRFTRNARRRRVIGWTAGGIVALLLAVLAFAVFSPVLALRSIRVEGASKVSPTAIRSALDDQRGTPLALLDESRIRSDLERFTLIRSYSTQIVPPNTLVVRIVEREPIAVVRNGSAFDRIDAAGVVLSTTAKRGAYPVLDVGTRAPSSRAFRSAVQVLLALPESLAPRVQAVTATTADNVRLTLTGSKRVVIWGAAASSTLKSRVLEVMLKQSACKTQDVIDVSAPRAPICGQNQS